jgi:phospholipid/cholesterol/gamma-HCH transport system permease protein
MVRFLASIGGGFLDFLASIGRVGSFAGAALSHVVRPPFYPRQLLQQLWQIGWLSLPVVGLTAIFTGMVLALQSYTGFSRFEAANAIASIVVISITRELGPVIGSLMVAGRIGAAIAAELGTMRVTEQIDALETLATDPMKYLVVPRVVAAVIVLPLLVLIADIIGVLGGYLVAVYALDFNGANYLQRTLQYLETEDVVSGLVKAGVFGLMIAVMGCYHGYNSQRGAAGVGTATTNAVVSASILILFANFFLTQLFFSR